MELQGTIKRVGVTKTFGDNGFKKRNLVIETNDQYPQTILLEFIQDKCNVLNSYKEGDNVTVGVNIRGREWVNDKGETKYFNTIQGWKITRDDGINSSSEPAPSNVESEEDLLPF